MPDPRTDLPAAFDERSLLTTMLGYARATAVAKCEGISAEDAAAAPLPSSPLMTVGGIVNHLRWVEYWWFDVIFLGGADQGPWTEDDPDREMRLGARTPLGKVIAAYETESARHDRLVAGTDLSATAQRPIRAGAHVTLGWILHHLIEETARHNGHLDILRELADGTKGA
ncbi:DinB family protein [Streptomyces triticagri]|uniref:DinB family protein n=1 Tax=Streptomyces triticagri TaxID=2293568 RepID=A0A372M4T1_9ACTN|nr:DinB family protein [Streptomyces triticagri]RFU85936.1 DinB family protein [Streptomyces triticagri]